MCVSLNICHMCVGVLRNQKRTPEPLELELHALMSYQGRWELNSSLLEEQQVLSLMAC